MSQPPESPADLQTAVGRSADAADLHATASALLLELQAVLGELSRAASVATGRGRRPFRPDRDWHGRLGEVGYRLYLLADQSGVQLDPEIHLVAERVRRSATRDARDGVGSERPASDWPLSGE